MINAVIFDMYETLITLAEGQGYFGRHMAVDLGLPLGEFLPLWHATENDRTLGRTTENEVISNLLKHFGCYSDEVLEKIISKRINGSLYGFEHMNPEIEPLLEELKKRELKVALISNCYFNEARVIRESRLMKYFDQVCLSYEEGVAKPDPEIYLRCLKKLGLAPGECLYVGDGGSSELEGAYEAGMMAVQALWYMKNIEAHPEWINPRFTGLKTPMEVLRLTEDC